MSTELLRILRIKSWKPHNVSSTVISTNHKVVKTCISTWGNRSCHIALQSAHTGGKSLGLKFEESRWALIHLPGLSLSSFQCSMTAGFRSEGEMQVLTFIFCHMELHYLAAAPRSFKAWATSSTNGWYYCWVGWFWRWWILSGHKSLQSFMFNLVNNMFVFW